MSKPLRPTGYATWAAVGPTNVAEPDSNHKNTGWGISEIPPSSYFNFLQQRYDQWIQYLDTTGNDYGNGIDGSIVLDGVATGGWISGPSGNAYGQLRDAFGVRIAVSSGITYNTYGFKNYCTDTFMATGSAVIAANASSGQGNGAPAAVGIANTLGAGATGAVAGGTANVNGTGGYTALNAFGGAGGGGGAGLPSFNGGAGGGVVAPSAKAGLPNVYDAVSFGQLIAGGTVTLINGGGGGGSAGNTNNFAGGGGDAGGGVLAIAARNISVRSTQNLKALVGNGGTGGTGAGGGGGGGGGFIMLAYQGLLVATGPSLVAAISCGGGFGGISVSSGATGGTGLAGTIKLIPAS